MAMVFNHMPVLRRVMENIPNRRSERISVDISPVRQQIIEGVGRVQVDT